jgi:hypothetical protein
MTPPTEPGSGRAPSGFIKAGIGLFGTNQRRELYPTIIELTEHISGQTTIVGKANNAVKQSANSRPKMSGKWASQKAPKLQKTQ